VIGVSGMLERLTVLQIDRDPLLVRGDTQPKSKARPLEWLQSECKIVAVIRQFQTGSSIRHAFALILVFGRTDSLPARLSKEPT
jgi:hypothetical protein